VTKGEAKDILSVTLKLLPGITTLELQDWLPPFVMSTRHKFPASNGMTPLNSRLTKTVLHEAETPAVTIVTRALGRAESSQILKCFDIQRGLFYLVGRTERKMDVT